MSSKIDAKILLQSCKTHEKKVTTKDKHSYGKKLLYFFATNMYVSRDFHQIPF
jgi:hypothetical protein